MRYLILLVAIVTTAVLAFKSPTTFNVKGIVQTGPKAPLIGATITEKGTRNSTASAADGTFQLTVASDQAVLEITSVGFEMKTVKLKGQSNVVITMSPAAAHLDEVLVDELETTVSGRVAGIQVGRAKKSDRSTVAASSPKLYEPQIFDKRQLPPAKDYNTEDYSKVIENRFLTVEQNPLSTFRSTLMLPPTATSGVSSHKVSYTCRCSKD